MKTPGPMRTVSPSEEASMADWMDEAAVSQEVYGGVSDPVFET
jgi:hypothetical protein